MRTTLYIAGKMSGLSSILRIVSLFVFIASFFVIDVTGQVTLEYEGMQFVKQHVGSPTVQKRSDSIIVTYSIQFFIQDTFLNGDKFKATITGDQTEVYFKDSMHVKLQFENVNPHIWKKRELDIIRLSTNRENLGTITEGHWEYAYSDTVGVKDSTYQYSMLIDNSKSIKQLARSLKFKLFPRKAQAIFGLRGSVEAGFMRSYANVAQFNKQEELDLRKDDEPGVGFTVGGFVGMKGKGGSGFYVSADYWNYSVELSGDKGTDLYTGLPVGTDESSNANALKSLKFNSMLIGFNYFYTSSNRRLKPIFELGAYYQYILNSDKWLEEGKDQFMDHHFGFSTGLGVSFRYFKAADFSLIPTFRYTFTSFNPDAEIASNNFGFGLKAQMTFLPVKNRW